MRLFRQKSALLFAAVALGCSDPLSPRSVAGFYELQAVNGQSLPVQLSVPPEGVMSVVGGSLMLTPEGFATTIEHREQVQEHFVTMISFSGAFTFELDGNDITLNPICPPTAFCGTLEGIISGPRVTLTFGSLKYEYTRAEDF